MMLYDCRQCAMRQRCAAADIFWEMLLLAQCTPLESLFAVQALRRAPAPRSRRDTEALSRALAAQQSGQLHALVQATLDAYVGFFQGQPVLVRLGIDSRIFQPLARPNTASLMQLLFASSGCNVEVAHNYVYHIIKQLTTRNHNILVPADLSVPI